MFREQFQSNLPCIIVLLISQTDNASNYQQTMYHIIFYRVLFQLDSSSLTLRFTVIRTTPHHSIVRFNNLREVQTVQREKNV